MINIPWKKLFEKTDGLKIKMILKKLEKNFITYS